MSTLLSLSGGLRRVSVISERPLALGSIFYAAKRATSGMAVPHYVIDAPGGGGKVPLSPIMDLNLRKTF